MKRYFALATALGLLAGCATQTQPSLSVPQAVRNMSSADDPIFSALLGHPCGVIGADRAYQPKAREIKLTKIEVITPYTPSRTGKERWFIEHESGPTAVYLVEIIPDGNGSAFFEVARDPGSSAP